MRKERKGEYLGATVQVIPHITDALKDKIKRAATTTDSDVIITEVGGTVGDIAVSYTHLDVYKRQPL